MNTRRGDQAKSAQNHFQSSEEMSESQALDILGLKEDAIKEDIIQAHRRMMQKVHPDRGGSTYLATKINAAKVLLIKIRG